MPRTSEATKLAVPSQREMTPFTGSTWVADCLRLCEFCLGVHGSDSGDDVGLGLWAVGDVAGLAVAVPSDDPRPNGGV